MNSNLKNPHLEGDSFLWEAGPVGIVLSHGFTATTTEVRLLAKALHEKGYTVAGPLLPGHGTRYQDMNRCRWQDWVRAVEQDYQELSRRCQRVVVGGESLGGLLALYVAAQHPEIAAVLTYAPALQTTPATMQIAAAIMAPFIPYRARGAEPPTAADPRWQGYPELPTRAAVQLFRLQRRMPRLLPAVRQPLLIVQGRKDKTVFPDSPARIAQLVSSPVKEVHWMERSTHCVLLDEEWEQAASITIKFLERVL